MFSARLIYSLGILVSLLNMCLWAVIIRAQIKGFNGNNSIFKGTLLVFTAISLYSNILPIWFDIFRLAHNANPTNLFYAYVMNNYLYRTISALLFYLMYRFLMVE